MLEQVISTPCVDALYMMSKRFRLVNNVWEREDVFQTLDPLRGGMVTLRRTVGVKIYDEVNPQLGTEIEVFINKSMIGSGYWMDRKDFLQTFTL